MRLPRSVKLSNQRIVVLIGAAFIFVLLVLLSALQYTTLIKLQDQTRAVYAETMREKLLKIEAETFGELKHLAESVLSRAELDPTASDVLVKFQGFSRTVASNPEVEFAILIFDCGCSQNLDEGFALLHEEGRVRRLGHREFVKEPHVKAANQAFTRAVTDRAYFDDSQGNLLGQFSCTSCNEVSGSPPQTFLFRRLVSGGTHVGVIGVRLKQAYIEKDLLPAALERAGLGPEFAVKISDDKATALYTANSTEAYAVETEFKKPLHHLNGAIGFTNSSVDVLTRQGFAQGMLLTTAVLFLLIVALVWFLRMINKELKLAHAKSVFVSNVSHELKTPLSSIHLFAELLELGKVREDQKRQEYYRTIANESARLGQMIDRMLDISRAKNEQISYNFEPTDMSDLVSGVITRYNEMLREAGITVHVLLPDSLPLIAIDRDAISAALLNLLDNAVKYSHDEKEVSVTVNEGRSAVNIIVADKGIGIPTAEQRLIFDEFYRVGNDLVHDVKGTGIGLAMVRNTVRAHNGSVTVQSKEGVGSEFTISLPIKPKAMKSSRANGGSLRGGQIKIAESPNS